MSIHSTAEEVTEGVRAGVNADVVHWSEQTVEALKNMPEMRSVVSQIIRKVQEEHPEAKWMFGLDQDREGFQLTIYSTSIEWDIYALVRTIVADEIQDRLGLYLMIFPLDDAPKT